KDGSRTFSQLSLVLQAICLVTVIFCDAFIIRKVYMIRKKRLRTVATFSGPSERSAVASNSTIMQGSSNPSQPNRFERRIAFAFLLLSLSFLVPTIFFNSREILGQIFLYNLVSKICNLLDYSKWMVYTLSLPSIRKQFLRTFCRLH
ncbi:hypothetical protein PMAYCL1PPCAC_08357, partial [Pristionchus mayeri]